MREDAPPDNSCLHAWDPPSWSWVFSLGYAGGNNTAIFQQESSTSCREMPACCGGCQTLSSPQAIASGHVPPLWYVEQISGELLRA